MIDPVQHCLYDSITTSWKRLSKDSMIRRDAITDGQKKRKRPMLGHLVRNLGLPITFRFDRNPKPIKRRELLSITTWTAVLVHVDSTIATELENLEKLSACDSIRLAFGRTQSRAWELDPLAAMKSDSQTPNDRFQPYNFRTRTNRVNYKPWFADPYEHLEETIKPVRTSKPRRGHGKNCARRQPEDGDSTSNQPKSPSPSHSLVGESSSVERLLASPAVPQTPSSDTGYRSVRGMIACALLEVCPHLQDLDDIIPELLESLNSVWSSDQTSFELPVGTTVEELQEVLQIDFDALVKAIRSGIDEIISLLEYALRALEKYNKIGRAGGSLDFLWRNARTEEFRSRNGSRITTLGKAMRCIRHEMAQLAQDVGGQLEAVKSVSRTTKAIKVSVHASSLVSSAVPKNSAVSLRILSKQCERAENELADTMKTLESLEGKLRKLLEEEGPNSVDDEDIDTDAVRPELEEIKSMREEVREEAAIKALLEASRL
ncbi:hypothetical protein V5O48_010895 [Marasmius crinis-equi]|uniref:Uncharacterized protein n=1 Tax=Marasmius crinis-equi TaxID=585013 RepID=A0ABR3F733_9AGAR